MADGMDDENKQQLLYFLLESSSSDSEEEDFLLNKTREEHPKVGKFIEDVVHNYSDKDFKKHFRVSRNTTNGIISKFENSQFYCSDRTHGGREAITAEKSILSFLWFAGNKSCLRDVSDRFGISVSGLHSLMERVMNFLIDIAPGVIYLPNTEEEKEAVAREFKEVSGFPGVIGCIDGTAIGIRTPANKIKSTDTNRHDVPSITLQAICDVKRRFLDVSTGTPGKIHDARVFKLSDVSKKLPHIAEKNYHILGDGAYAIREYLLTPYKDYGHFSESQRVYNGKFSATRVIIENSFGILKGRFRQLQQLDMHSFKNY